jgi:hypothetical protein
MKNNRILTDQVIRIKARIRDLNGDLVDPDSIIFELKKPGDDIYTILNNTTYPSIVKESTGIYYIDIYVDEPGRYKYSWFTIGYPETSWKSFFEAENSRYI